MNREHRGCQRKICHCRGKKQLVRHLLPEAHGLLTPRLGSDGNSPVIEMLGPTSTKQDIKETSTKRGKIHLFPASGEHWLGQRQNLPKLINRKTWKSHVLMQIFGFPFPVNDPRILSVLPRWRDQTRYTMVPEVGCRPGPSQAKYPPWESSLAAVVTTPEAIPPALSPREPRGPPRTMKSTQSKMQPFPSCFSSFSPHLSKSHWLVIFSQGCLENGSDNFVLND